MADDQVRFMFWMGTFFLVAIMFYGVAMMLLPRLIIYGQLPEAGQLYVDNADALATRIATNICNLWQARDNFKSGYESVSEYKVTSGTVDANGIQSKIVGIECDKIILPGDWNYIGGAMTSGKKTYAVTISTKSDASNIEIKVA